MPKRSKGRTNHTWTFSTQAGATNKSAQQKAALKLIDRAAIVLADRLKQGVSAGRSGTAMLAGAGLAQLLAARHNLADIADL